MKQLNKLIFLLFLTSASVYAQDVITLRNGNEIRARVIDISLSEIRYRRFENLDGPTIVVPTTDVFFINYENGTREIFNSQADQPATNLPQGAVPQNIRNTVSNIRVEQIGKMLHVAYDLDELSNVEAQISFNNGATYRNRPLQRVSGAVGRNVHAGRDRLLIWDIVKEVGYIDYSGIVVRIVANGVIAAENTAETDITIAPYKYDDRFYAGVVGGMDFNIFIYGSTDAYFGFNGAYFFNRRIGAGFAMRNANIQGDLKIIFFGPVFYSHLLQSRNGKFIFPICIGISNIHIRYTYEDTFDTDWGQETERKNVNHNFLGYFVSGGIAYRPINLISVGLNIEYNSMFNKDNVDNNWYFDYIISKVNQPFITLGLNFHF